MRAKAAVQFIFNHVTPELRIEKLVALIELFCEESYNQGYEKGKRDANESTLDVEG